jgi:hypothetical protein
LKDLIERLDDIESKEIEQKKENANPASENFIRDLSKVLLRSEYDSLFETNDIPFNNIYQTGFFKSLK